MNNTALGIESSLATGSTFTIESPLATSENGALVQAAEIINPENSGTFETSEALDATAGFFLREEAENKVGLSLTHPGYLATVASILVAGGLQVTEVGRTLNISPREVQEIVTVTACCLIPSLAFLGGSLYFYYKVAQVTVGAGKAVVGKVGEVSSNLIKKGRDKLPKRSNADSNKPALKPRPGPVTENRPQNTQQQGEMRPSVKATVIEQFYKEIVTMDSKGFPPGADAKLKESFFKQIFKHIPENVTTLTLQGQTVQRPGINPNQQQVVWNDGDLIRHLNNLKKAK